MNKRCKIVNNIRKRVKRECKKKKMKSKDKEKIRR